MISITSKSTNYSTSTTKWSYWPRSEFMAKFAYGDPAWRWRNVLVKAGLEPTAVYFRDGVKHAEQFRLKKDEWPEIWRDPSVPKHAYDVKYGEGKVVGDGE